MSTLRGAEEDVRLALGVLAEVVLELAQERFLVARELLAVVGREVDGVLVRARRRARPRPCGGRPSPSRACAPARPAGRWYGTRGRRRPRKAPRSSARCFEARSRAGVPTPPASLPSASACRNRRWNRGSIPGPGPPRTTRRFQPIAEMRTCLSQNCAETCVACRRARAAGATCTVSARYVSQPVSDERERAGAGAASSVAARSSAANAAIDEVAPCASRAASAAGRRGEDQRLEPEGGVASEPLPERLEDGDRMLAPGDAEPARARAA